MQATLPKRVTLVLGNLLYLEKAGIPAELSNPLMCPRCLGNGLRVTSRADTFAQNRTTHSILHFAMPASFS